MNPEARKLTHRVAILAVGITLLVVVALSGTVTAQAAGTIKGEVENAAGEDIEGADIFVDGQRVTQTGTEGSYQTSVNVGLVDISVDSDDYERTTQSEVVVTTNETTEVDFVPERTTEPVTGEITVEDPNTPVGNPLLFSETGEIVTIRVENHPDQQLIRSSDELKVATRSNEKSQFRIDVPTTTESFDLVIEQDGFQTVRQSVTTSSSANILLENTLGTVEGTVSVADGPPVEDATVSVDVDPAKWTGLNNAKITDQTDANGNYSIQAPGGSRTVTVEAETFQPAERTVDFESDDTTITDFNLSLTHNVLRIDSVTPRTAQSDDTVTVDYTYANDDFNNILLRLSDADGAIYTQDISVEDADGQVSFQMPEGTTLTEEYNISLITPRRQATASLNDPTLFTDNKLTIDSVTPQTAQSGETVSVLYNFSGVGFETVDFTVGNQDQIVPTETVDIAESAGEITFEIPDRSEIEDGSYTITLSTPRRTATETIRVLNPVDPEAVGVGELGEESYRAPAGDFVEITTGGEYMLIGGDRPSDNSDTITQYLDVLYVEEGSTTINTRLVGTAVSSDRAYGEGVKSYAHSIGADSEPRGDFADVSFTGASTLAEFRQNLGIDSRATPLQTGRYRLLAGENGRITVDSGVPRFRKPVGRSNLILTQPQLVAVNTYVLPPESANAEDVAGPSDDATESNTIAEGERLLIEIQATGMYGATTDDPTAESIPPAAIADLLAKPEGVHMDLSTWYYDGSKNTEADLQFSDVSPSDIYVIPDTTTDQWEDETVIGEDSLISGLYIVVDTRGEAFSAPAYGDVMQFTTAYESPDGSRYLYQDTDAGTQPRPFAPAIESDDGVEQYPYFGATDTTVTVTSKVEFMEPSIQYGRTTVDGSLVVPAENGGQILGSTTLAPGTQATIQLIDQSRSDPELVTIDEVTIEDDRTFTASADFSELASGDQVTVEFYTAGRLPGNRVIDRRDARVVEDINNIANYQITNFSGTVEVQQRSSLAEVEATINNTGELTGQQVVRFSVDGKPIRNESLRLSGNGNATLDLSDQFVTLPVGTYEYTVQTDNDEQTGELRVASPESGTTITSEDTNTTTTSSPLDENELPGENGDESDPNGLFGIVGVSGRDVALGAALTGTAHVLGYWT